MSPPLIVILKNFKTTVIDCGFMIIMIKKYFINNIKITILLKRAYIKNNFETTDINNGFKENCKITIINCDFKDISKTFKTTVINSGFLHLKINFTDILRWVVFLPFFSPNVLFWT